MPLRNAVVAASESLLVNQERASGLCGNSVRQLLVEFRVVGHDRRHRRGHGLLQVAARQRRRQLLLRLLRAQEQEARRRAVGRGRAHLQQVVQCPQFVVGDRLVGELVVGARLAEQQVEPGGVERHMQSP